jgi:hypothetical protein
MKKNYILIVSIIITLILPITIILLIYKLFGGGLSFSSLPSKYNYNWTHINPSPTNEFLGSIAYGNNTFVAVGLNGAIVVSNNNGNSWNSINPSPTINHLYSIAYGNNTFVAVGDNGAIVVGNPSP